MKYGWARADPDHWFWYNNFTRRSPGILYTTSAGVATLYPIPGPTVWSGAASPPPAPNYGSTVGYTVAPVWNTWIGNGFSTVPATLATSLTIVTGTATITTAYTPNWPTASVTTSVTSSSASHSTITSTSTSASTSTISSRSSSAASSTTSAAPTSSASTGGTVAKYGQCGGIGYTGATACVSGTTCTELNSVILFSMLVIRPSRPGVVQPCGVRKTSLAFSEYRRQLTCFLYATLTEQLTSDNDYGNAEVNAIDPTSAAF
ncbi:hypothetical protein JAAARDRAFT_200055 [Jaapia argillacea MUCL 33604]|uniref:CBM1 domain-containing protein n=1 Tax=Jaapia argillacea MUCL 33604 TaxID=933084 RepID=A0A067P647_9AGAM|nr:hypothetical protein JAAARDRAFT_200055 [Jaapia argillacea MUCL 33604]